MSFQVPMGSIVGATNLDVAPEIIKTRPSQVTIQGGMAGCLSGVIEQCLDFGIPVTVNLANCRVHPWDSGEEPIDCLARRIEIENILEPPYLSNPQLVFIPDINTY